jgi:hypothetical protein
VTRVRFVAPARREFLGKSPTTIAKNPVSESGSLLQLKRLRCAQLLSRSLDLVPQSVRGASSSKNFHLLSFIVPSPTGSSYLLLPTTRADQITGNSVFAVSLYSSLKMDWVVESSGPTDR